MTREPKRHAHSVGVSDLPKPTPTVCQKATHSTPLQFASELLARAMHDELEGRNLLRHIGDDDEPMDSTPN